MYGEEGVKAAFDFLHAMRKIETMPPTTQDEIDAIKDGILNMARDVKEIEHDEKETQSRARP